KSSKTSDNRLNETDINNQNFDANNVSSSSNVNDKELNLVTSLVLINSNEEVVMQFKTLNGNDETDINEQNEKSTINTIDDETNQGATKAFMRKWSIKHVFSKRKKKINNKSNYSIKHEDKDIPNSTFKEEKKNSDNNPAVISNEGSTLSDQIDDAIITSQDEQIIDFLVIPPNHFSENIVTTCFHLIMPKEGLNKKSMVFVIGNIKELGNR
ncbi:5162_t:CDS:1, partial [Scutellospora calospora]